MKKLSDSDFEKIISSEAFRPLIEFLQRILTASNQPSGLQPSGSRNISP